MGQYLKLLLFISFCHLIEAQSTVFLTGKIINPRADKIYIRYFKDYLTYEEETADSAIVDKTGKFSISFNWTKPSLARLYYGYKETQLFIGPNDSLKIKFDARDFEESIKYTGNAADINNYLVQKKLLFPGVNGSVFKFPENKFTPHLDSVHHQELSYFRDYFTPVDENRNTLKFFLEFEEAEINYEWANNKLNYQNSYSYNKRLKNPIQLPGNYYDFLKELSIHNPKAIHSKVYLQFLNSYIDYEAEKIRQRDTSKKLLYIQETFIEKNFSGEIIDFLFANLTYQTIYRQHDLMNGKRLLEKYMRFSTSKIYTEILNKALILSSRLNVGNPAPDFTFTDLADKPVSLSDFTGKIVCLKFWASWSNPCLMEIPFAITLEKEMKDKDIVFIWLNIDQNKTSWKKIIKEKKMEGLQFYVSGSFDSKAAKLYNVVALPHYVIIDKEGKIIDANAINASDLKLKKLLEESEKSE